jgi:hypothetical protein
MSLAMLNNILWYINRLQTMSFPEVFFRAKQFAQKKLEKHTKVGVKIDRIPFQPTSKVLFQLPYHQLKVLPNQLEVFNIHIDYTKNINWHLDPSSNKEFPRIFAKEVDIRTGQYGSAKHTWEVNRLQFLTKIAINYRITKDPYYLNLFQDIVKSWVLENPYLVGVNWYSNIEVNLRLITWFLAWEILDVNDLVLHDPGFLQFVEKTWLPTIYQHCQYSHANPSYFSSANNHLISEYAGLFIAASFWQFPESQQWVQEAKHGLEKEILLQHAKSGANKEEATEYIQFITDFFLLSYIVGERTNNSFSTKYTTQLKAIFHYIHELAAHNGKVFFYGDEDDGKTFILNTEEPFDNFRSLFTTGAVLFQEAVWKHKSAGFDSKNYFLLGEHGKAIFDELPVLPPVSQSVFFEDQGHYLMKSNLNGKEIYIHIDAAPLGFLSIAAHGHADALSFTLAVDGKPVFIDPGTYTYHTERDWRNYFISTLAHNTVQVDRLNQAKSTGPTMWQNHYHVTVAEATITPHEDYIKAFHNGYDTIGVKHTRSFLFNKPKGTLTITDHIQILDKKNHIVDIPFHLYPALHCTQTDHKQFVLGYGENWQVVLQPDPTLHFESVRGQVEPFILGWYSPSFQKKEPTTTLFATLKVEETTTFVHQIQVIQS